MVNKIRFLKRTKRKISNKKRGINLLAKKIKVNKIFSKSRLLIARKKKKYASKNKKKLILERKRRETEKVLLLREEKGYSAYKNYRFFLDQQLFYFYKNKFLIRRRYFKKFQLSRNSKKKRKKNWKPNRFKLLLIEESRKLRGPFGTTFDLGKALVAKRKKRKNRFHRIFAKKISSKVTLNLFRITYTTLLQYHAPFGALQGEWKPGVQLTNILLIRNKYSILNITSVFFELRKAINRLFKATKLRKGIAVLTGRRYGWKKVFTFLFETWLPGFFTNFWLNISELTSYFFKRRCLTRRQKTRVMSLKMLNYDRLFLKKRKAKITAANLISYFKLPSVSLSLTDNVFWLRECLKEGISTIQIADSNTELEKLDYPLVSNQNSLAYLSFVNLLAKEIAYQGRYWEIRNFKYNNYFSVKQKNKRITEKFKRKLKLLGFLKILKEKRKNLKKKLSKKKFKVKK